MEFNKFWEKKIPHILYIMVKPYLHMQIRGRIGIFNSKEQIIQYYSFWILAQIRKE